MAIQTTREQTLAGVETARTAKFDYQQRNKRGRRAAYLAKLADLEAESGLAAAATGGFFVIGGGLGLGISLGLLRGSLRGSLATWSFRAVICDTGYCCWSLEGCTGLSHSILAV